jgi:hypothetical protein|tara:strand:- start:4690 stop:5046 length:357 start_codon:yes stop_codon:yes gene_type:complete
MAVQKYFNETIFPYTNNCQTLDAQISKLRSDYADVVSKKMKGNANKVDDLLTDKEIQFAKLFCEQKLADESVYGTLDTIGDRFEQDEDRILGEVNKKRAIALVGGGLVLLIALAVFVK